MDLSKKMYVKRIYFEIIVILSFVILVAFLGNHLNPKGIALFGQWNKDKGVVSAVSKDAPVIPVSFEINDVKEAKSVFDEGRTLFVDARAEEVFRQGRVKGAISLPVDDFNSKGQAFLDKYPPATRMIVYCSGRECEDSHTLAGFFKDLGYSNVRIMIDGYPGWEKGGYPVEKD